jgi:hypothetical protein
MSDMYFIVEQQTGVITAIVPCDDVADFEASRPGLKLYPVEQGVEVGDYRQPDGSYGKRSLVVEKMKKASLVDAAASATFKRGYTPASGPLAGHTLQVRDNEDRTNWLTSQASYMAAVAAGMGNVPGAVFRTMANETVTLTFAEGAQVLVSGMAVWGKSIMGHAWGLKDAIKAVETFEELEAIDIDSGWPS